MPSLLYALEDYFDAAARDRRGRVSARLMAGASAVFAVAGDAVNPDRKLTPLFHTER